MNLTTLRFAQNLMTLVLVSSFLASCTTTESNVKGKASAGNFQPDGRNSLLDNEWLNLQNVGYALKGADVIWTAGGAFKVETIREITVNDYSDLNNRKLLFSSKTAIPRGNYMAESKPLRGKELDWLKNEGPTVIYAEVVLVDVNGEKKALYTPIAFSAASKKTVRTVLDSLNPNWKK